MGFGDKFKNIASQAKEAVAEHKDQLHDALDAVSVAANEKTGGKHARSIQKLNQKASGALHKVSGSGEGEEEAQGAESSPAESSPAASFTPPSGPPPSFEDHAQEPAAPAPAPTYTPPTGDGPSFDE
jgi:antitoxin protein of toxin-antitoxin system